MPDNENVSSYPTGLEQQLDRMLLVDQPPADDDFVINIMGQVRKEQRSRRIILTVSGLVGAVFGVAGAFTLSDNMAALIRSVLETAGPLPMGLALAAALTFFTWLLHDDGNLAV